MPPIPARSRWTDATELLSDARGGLLDVTITPNPAAPGQPLQVAWAISVPSSTSFTATAQILLGSTVLFTSPPTTSAANPAIPHAQLAQGTAAINPSPTDPGGRDLYSFGTKTLSLQVALSTDPAGHAPRRTVGYVDIVPETLDASWWTWSEDGGTGWRVVPWGATYGVEGVLTNRSTFATVTGTLALNEGSGSASLQRGTASLPALAPGASFDLASQPIVWNNANNAWTSFDGWVVFFTTEQFGYWALFTLMDGYGNPYPQTTSSALNVSVVVEGWKEAAGGAAFLASVSAIALTACAIGAAASWFGAITAPAFLAAAAVATAAAAAAYGTAIDPVDRDMDYAIAVLPPDPPALPAETPVELVAMCEPLVHCATALNAVTLLSAIDGRIMGARADNESAAADAHTAAREEMVTLALEEAEAAAAALPAALAEWTKFHPAVVEKLIRQLCTNGLPGTLTTAFAAAMPAAGQPSILSQLTPDHSNACAVAPSTVLTALVLATVKVVESKH